MKQHIDGYANYVVEGIREQMGLDYDDSSQDDKVLERLQAGGKISKLKHLAEKKEG